MSDYETFDALFIQTLELELSKDDEPEPEDSSDVLVFSSILGDE